MQLITIVGVLKYLLRPIARSIVVYDLKLLALSALGGVDCFEDDFVRKVPPTILMLPFID